MLPFLSSGKKLNRKQAISALGLDEEDSQASQQSQATEPDTIVVPGEEVDLTQAHLDLPLDLLEQVENTVAAVTCGTKSWIEAEGAFKGMPVWSWSK